MTILFERILACHPAPHLASKFHFPKYARTHPPDDVSPADSWKDGDALFVTAWAEPAFRYYAPFYGLEDVEYVSSRIEDYPDGERLKSRISLARRKEARLGLVLPRHEQGGFNERDYLVDI
ncbi:MAG: hypothetical protein U0X92_14525 [Anaerolineales bacterium]